MSYQPHEVIKPQAIADAMVTGLSDELSVANTFTRFSAEQFLGKDGDKIVKRVPGTLPYRTWGFRNARREPLKVDSLTETKVTMTIEAEWIYSGIEMTPEQKQFDFGGDWGYLFNAQTDALVRGIERDALRQIVDAPYELVQNIDVTPANVEAQARAGRDHMFNQFTDLRAKLRRMRVPDQQFTVLAGANFVSELRKSGKLYDANVQGRSALASDPIGVYAGFNVVEGPYTMDPNRAYVYSRQAFLFWNAAPPAPEGAIKAASANKNGLSLQWIMDYDPAYAINRSIYQSWKSWSTTKDFLAVEGPAGQLLTSPDEFFIRGIELILTTEADANADGSMSDIPAKGDVASRLRYPGDSGTKTPGGDPNSYLALAYAGKLADGTVPDGLWMPPHLRADHIEKGAPPAGGPAADGVPVVTP